MFYHNILSRIVGSKAKSKVLEQLLRFPEKEYTGRELAVHAGVSQPQTGFVLNVLKENGLVESKKVGNAFLWKLNNSHFLVRQFRDITDPVGQLTIILLSELRERLDLRKVERIVLFGSVARGSERPTSDIDLLIVVKKGGDKEEVRNKALAASVELSSVLGNPIIPVVYSIEEAVSKKNSPLFKNIWREGKILFENGETE